LKKRGMLLVVVLLILLSFSVFGQETLPLNTFRHESLWVESDNNAGDSCPEADTATVVAFQQIDVQLETQVGDPSSSWKEEFDDDGGDAGGDWAAHLSPATQGCWMHGFEQMDYNGYGWAKVKPGTVLTPGQAVDSWAARSYSIGFAGETFAIGSDELPTSTSVGEDVEGVLVSILAGIPFLADALTSMDEEACMMITFNSPSQNALLCDDDHYWHECIATPDDDADDIFGGPGTIAWANNKLYECVINEDNFDQPAWKELDYDYDQDGWTPKQGDCADNPEAEGLQHDNCPVLDKETGEINCDYTQHSACAICINPGAPEVCGDGLNNDCRISGGDFGSLPEDLLGDSGDTTFDNCHKNEAACTQRLPSGPPPPPETGAGAGECSDTQYETPQDCEDEGEEWTESSPGTETDTEGEDEEESDQPVEVQQLNIFGESFSWVDTNDEGYCCGFNGSSDLGKIVDDTDGNNLICLHKDEDIVGREADIEGVFPDGVRCEESDSWCWVNAIGGAQFQILTIKPYGKEAYDVVSNNQKWFACAAEGGIEAPTFSEEGLEEAAETANRFYCYREGNHWSFAECAAEDSDRKNAGIKGRYAGEGLYTLRLKEGNDIDAISEDYGTIIDVKASLYDNFYGNDFYLDFSDYDYLNFMIKFVLDEEGTPISEEDLETKLNLPADATLTIFGPEQIGADGKKSDLLYFEGSVLGYVVNNPLFSEEGWMQVQVPIDDSLKGIRQIVIKSAPSTNIIGVRNIYLSKEGEESMLCSGKDDRDDSSWLTDLDQGNEDQTDVIGKDLCTALYGPNAWLGNDDQVDTPTANCCGNQPNEYYAGSSQGVIVIPEGGEVVDGQVASQTEPVSFGCWNSAAIASGDTIMNVEFEVQYFENDIDITYPTELFSYEIKKSLRSYERCIDGLWEQWGYQSEDDCKVLVSYGQCTEQWEQLEFQSETDCKDSLRSLSFERCTERWEQLGYPSEGECNDAFRDYERCVNGEWQQLGYQSSDDCEALQGSAIGESLSSSLSTSSSGSAQIDFSQSPKQITELTITRDDLFVSGLSVVDKIDIISESDVVDVYFFNPLTADQGTTLFSKNLPYKENKVFVIAEVNDNYKITKQENEVPGMRLASYSCNKDECLFPLPGLPPYTITNPHPDLYELYFVTSKLEEDETLITPSSNQFDAAGNIKARKVAQQVLYHSEGEDGSSTPVPYTSGFYGCQAADFLVSSSTLKEENNLPYCAVIGGTFCSYSVQQEFKKEKFTTVNSWSSEAIEKVGYEEVQYPDEENISFYYSEIELQLKDEPFSASERNHSSSVLPGRNFLSNAEFSTSGQELPHWEIINTLGTFVKDERGYVQDGRVSLATGEKLRTERIAVVQDSTLHFSQDEACLPTAILVDKNGAPSGDGSEVTSIYTGEASYLLLEFAGPCVVERPMLQLLEGDDAAAVEYSYISQPDLDNFDARAGAACCPKDYCWNGYACVEPMTELTSLAEHISDGRDYRCVDGQWERSSPKFDWNADKWGFCSREEQCFVLSSEFGSKEYSAGTFPEGKYPLCIDDGEYILDHYCDAGQWTSRTKFLATKLMEVADNDEYVLYCSPYREVLPDFENKEAYIGGDLPQVQKKTQDLSKAILGPGKEEVLRTCFTGILDPQGKRLVDDAENTCVNNVCVLQYKEGGRVKVAFATTLNRPIESERSFLLSLDVPQNKVGQLCAKSADGSFIECDLSQLSQAIFPSGADLLYSGQLNALIYAQEGISVNPGLLDKILKWFGDLFDIESSLSGEKAFVSQAQNFRDLYVLKSNDQEVRAVKEVFPGIKQTLIAEYENFQTPVCDYVTTIALPPELETELLEEVSGISRLSCTLNGSVQRVEMVEGLDFFWPQLTGRLRVE